MVRNLVFLILFACSFTALSVPYSKIDTPEPLKPWVDWVLQGEEDYQCPFLYNNFQQKRCQWPGQLDLELHSTQAKFSSHWQIFKESWVVLPGNQKFWPQNVTVSNKPVLVIAHQGKPSILLAAGSYIIEGSFFWDRIPDSLTIPYNTGLFSLKILDKKVAFPTVKRNIIWLNESDRGQKKLKSIENKLDLQVFRKIDDNVPLQLTTYLELEVSGDPREIKLPYALLDGFIPINLKSPLPAKIEADGSLRVQIRPGRWQIELNARSPSLLEQLSFNVSDTQWPVSEIWSFKARPFQRVVEVENVKAIDPSQTNIPGEWQSLPAYQLKQGDTLVFKQIRRGDPKPEPNQLHLKRKLWLDFNGDAYTVTDTITGKMTEGWRLNALKETQLGQVKLNGKSQLVTHSSEDQKPGVEVRKGHIDLVADSRITHSITEINAVGWEHKFNQVEAELNLPPGWRLLTVSGVDNDPDSWVSQWTLLDLFLVLIASLAISRLWSVVWGLVALVTLSICWHEPEAPRYIWLNILVAIALIRVLPAGTFQNLIKGYRNISWLVLVVLAIPFMVSQIRVGLYPQLEQQWRNTTFNMMQPMINLDQESVAMEQDMFKSESSGIASSLTKMRTLASPLSLKKQRKKALQKVIERVDPDANIQTGPGLPQWQWKKIYLSWNGSVDSQQHISLWYLSPVANFILNICRVIFIVILSLLMFGLLDKTFKFSRPQFCWVFLIPILGLPVQDASASFPEQQMLDELKTRLLKAPECLPVCAQIPLMNVAVNQTGLTIKLEVHAQKTVAIPLPAKYGQWFPNKVTVNGRTAKALIRNNDGSLWLNLIKGIHQVELRGLTPAQNKFSLPLTLKPHRTSIDNKSWEIEGLHESGRTDNQLIFNRVKTVQQQVDDKKQKLEPNVFPTFIRIERTLNLALDWSITTRVIRVVNNDAALVLKFPLLKGESVTTSNIRVKDKVVQINMSAKQNSFQWQSALEKSSHINLIAADTDLWTEVWRVDVSPLWHIQTSGISVVHHQDRGRWLPEWRPWPGEQVRLEISRPDAVQGATLTIDKTELHLKPGKRTIESQLKFTVRSSKGTQHTVQIPEQAQLQSVMINGVTQPIRQRGRAVSLPIKPGQQEISLNWSRLAEQSMILVTPQVNMGVSSVNNHIKVLLGRDRWVLLTKGPKFGPAVLFWGVLVVLIIFSVGLGKISLTPLKSWQWFLLLIGLSQISIVSALVVVLWLMALGIRQQRQVNTKSYFNAVQSALAVLTIIALLLLFSAVEHGLLGAPDMQIAGNQSTAFNLNWYQDRSAEILPTAKVISVPLIGYRILMLLWALWLAVSLLNWLKWGWFCFSQDGIWKKLDLNKDSSGELENKGND